MEGHCIDGRVLLPATGYLYFVWKTLAKHIDTDIEDCSVKFEDVTFHRATMLHDDGNLIFIFISEELNIYILDFATLDVHILTSTAEFRISEKEDIVVTGKVFILKDDVQLSNKTIDYPYENGEKLLTKSEVYKILRLRGYNYDKMFKGISQMDQKGM